MATEPLDLSQLDLNDPETRQYVESQLDLNDPATKAEWSKMASPVQQNTAPEPVASEDNFVLDNLGKGVRGLLQGAGGLTDLVGGPLNAGINWATGLQMSTSPGHDVGRYLADQLGLKVPESDMDELANAINEGGIQGLLSAGAGSLVSGAKGVTGMVGKALAESPLLDTISGAFQGLFGEGARQAGAGTLGQVGASIVGGLTPFGARSAGRGLYNALTDDGFVKGAVADYRSDIERMLDEGATSDEIRAYVSSQGVDPSQVTGLDEAVAAKAEGRPVQVQIAEGEPGATLAREAEQFTPSREPVVEDLFPTEESIRAREAELESRLTAEAEAFQAGRAQPSEEAVPVAPVADSEAVTSIRNKVDEIKADWENAPDVEIMESFDNLEGFDPDAIGATTPEGRVVLNAKSVYAEAEALGVSPEDIVSAATFHESLGHYGLSQRFGNELDNLLTNLYENSGKFRRDVDSWMEKNPDYYAEDLNPTARAAEEVLAEMSENGRISPTLYNRIKNKVKDFARQMGINLEFSNREIRTILGMAHDAVVTGNGRNVAANGFRLMRRRTVGRGSEGQLQGSATQEDAGVNTPIAKFRSNRNLEDIAEEIAPERTVETWEDWIDEAGNIKMSTKAAENLATGVSPPQLKAAERFLLESQNRIFDLSRKVGQGVGTERDAYLLGQEIERAKRVAQSIHEVVSNSARILNSRKIEVASDRALSDNIRRMLRSIDSKSLQTPEGAKKAADLLMKGDVKSKRMGQAMDILANALSFPRSIMSSMDLSAPLRQGVFLTGRKELWKGIPSMFKQFGSEAAFDAVMRDIKARPTYRLMEESNLALSDLGNKLLDREERFISTWAEKIPVVGRGVRASERAYTGFLNKLRADVFDDIVRKYEKAGIPLSPSSDQIKDISRFVNNATGRGSLGRFTQSAPVLSGIFFSPRLIASRVNMLRPDFYAKLDPIVRKEALKSLASFGGLATTVTTLAALAGANVETDPRSSDFAKIRVNNTRYDILGGFGQYLTLGSRLVSNQKKNAKGEVVTLGEGYGADTRLDVLLNFGINKESPVASYVTDYLRGRDAIGEPFDATKSAIERFIPLFFQDAVELTKEEGAAGIPMSLPGLFGIGMQTYDINLGYDAFGRDIKALRDGDKEETDPVVLEINRLNENSKNPVLTRAPASYRVDGESIKLDEEARDEWQRVMGSLQHQFLTEEMSDPEWQTYSDEDKIDIIKEVHRDAFQQTKDYFLENSSTEPSDEEINNEEATTNEQ